MRPVGKKWRRPALVLTSVGLVVVVGCFAASSQTVRAMFAGGALASTTPGGVANSTETGHGHGHGGDEPTVKTTLWAEQDRHLPRTAVCRGGKGHRAALPCDRDEGRQPGDGGKSYLQGDRPGQSTVEVRIGEADADGHFHPFGDVPEGRHLSGQDDRREPADRRRRRDDRTAAGRGLCQYGRGVGRREGGPGRERRRRDQLSQRAAVAGRPDYGRRREAGTGRAVGCARAA